MDGLPNSLDLPSELRASSTAAVMPLYSPTQRTLKSSVMAVGLGVHSGRRVRVALHQAAPGTGIVFRRTDLPGAPEIPARFDQVSDTRLCTVLSAATAPEARVGTVEHLMAALSGAGVDNALVELDGPEVPILDGSADPFLFLIDCAGVLDQGVPRRVVQIRRAVRVEDGDAFVELRPLARAAGAAPSLEMSLAIDFPAAAIGRQALSLTLSEAMFRQQLARARTFAMASDVAQMRECGLALGGSLDNALIVDGARVLNPGGLRMTEEFVRHKMLDAVGDLSLAGARLSGRYIGHKAGHRLNNAALRALFAHSANWRMANVPLASGWVVMPETAAASPA